MTKSKPSRASLLSLTLQPPYTTGALKNHLKVFEDHDQVLRELVLDKDGLRIIKAQLFLESLPVEITQAMTENRTFPKPVTYHKVRAAYVQLQARAVRSRKLEYGPQPVHQRLSDLEAGQVLSGDYDLATQFAHLRVNETPKRTHIRFPDTPKAVAALDADTSSDEADSSYRPSTTDEESSDEDDDGSASDEHSSLHPRYQAFDEVINAARNKLEVRDRPIFDKMVDTALTNLAAALSEWRPLTTSSEPKVQASEQGAFVVDRWSPRVAPSQTASGSSPTTSTSVLATVPEAKTETGSPVQATVLAERWSPPAVPPPAVSGPQPQPPSPPVATTDPNTKTEDLAATLPHRVPQSDPIATQPVSEGGASKIHTSQYDLRQISLVLDESATHHVIAPGFLMARRRGPKATCSSTVLSVESITLNAIGKLYISEAQDTNSKGDLVGIEIPSVYVGGASRVGSELNILSTALLKQQGWVFETSPTRDRLSHPKMGVSFDVKKTEIVGGKDSIGEIVACAWWRMDE